MPRVESPSPQPNDKTQSELPLSLRFWAAIVVLGVGTGLSSAGLMALLRYVQHHVWQSRGIHFLAAVEAAPGWYRVAVLAGTGIAGGLAMWLIRRSRGWKSVEVNRALWLQRERLPLLQTPLVAAISIVLVGGGASLGREHSAKQMGALIGSKLAERFGFTPYEWRVLTALGSGTGMGSIYNMPIGGALFGMEVLLGSFSLRLALPALALGGIATLVSWVYLPAHPKYLVPYYQFSIVQVAWAVLVGPLFGVISSVYIRLIRFAAQKSAQRHALLVAPPLVLTALGALAMLFPQLLGNGKPVVQAAFVAGIGVSTALWLILLKPLATAACLWSGLPGGLFTPTLTLGAVLGIALGAAWRMGFPGAPLGSYALIGAGAMIAAATQGPISSLVMIGELTGRLTPFLVPLTLCTALAATISRLCVSDSIYSGRL